MESLFTGRIGLVIHLAALLSSAGEKHPDLAWQINADATWNLMRQSMSHAEAHGHTVRFVYPSSIAVHGRDASQSHPLTEDEAMVPRTLYGVTKRAMEQAGTWLSEECGRMLGQNLAAPWISDRSGIPVCCRRKPSLLAGPAITPPRWCMPQSEVKTEPALFRVMLDFLL